MRRFPWMLTLCVAPLLAVLIGLGTWQAQRLAWKQTLIAAAESAAARPPAPLAQVLAEGGDPEFRRVRVTCTGLARAPFVELRSLEDGTPGVRLISACRPVGESRTWLVDRGFVAEAVPARPPVDASDPGAVTLEAVLRRPGAGPGAFTPEPDGRVFYARDADAMARVLAAAPPVAPWVLFAVDPGAPAWPDLHASAPPAAFSNNHLGYAATWFGLALALAGFYIAMVARRMTS